MIFKQLLDKTSCTLTYILADSGEAVIIDPVDTNLEVYLEYIKANDLKLKYSFETHVHADHISGSGLLRQATGAKTGIGLHCGAEMADFQLEGGEEFVIGSQAITTFSTPGHTPGSMCFLWNDRLFTGDTLFIGGCGRTDFQNGSSADLYDSITEKIFTLPGEILVYPGHDYKGNYVSCVQQEKASNPRLAGKTKQEFIEIMDNLNLPMPKMINTAVPANLYCGIDEEEALQMVAVSEFVAPEKDRRGVQGAINRAKQDIEQVDVVQAKKMLEQSQNIVILDVREKNEYEQGHIDNSINLPRGEVKNNSKNVLVGNSEDTPILIYCATGNRSALAGVILQELGYNNLSSLKGGYVAWNRDS